jgi:hypothetical protein
MLDDRRDDLLRLALQQRRHDPRELVALRLGANVPETLARDEQRASGDELQPRALPPECDRLGVGDAVVRVEERIRPTSTRSLRDTSTLVARLTTSRFAGISAAVRVFGASV